MINWKFVVLTLVLQCAIPCGVETTARSALENHQGQFSFLILQETFAQGGAHRVRFMMSDEAVCIV